MEQSILNSIKKNLDVDPDDTSFDLDIITHINSAFSILTDLGVGPPEGFVIEDNSTEWATYLADDPVKLSKVKTVIYLRTRLLFDPPAQGFLLDAIRTQLQEMEWRLSVNRENLEWVDANPIEQLEDEELVEGGFGL